MTQLPQEPLYAHCVAADSDTATQHKYKAELSAIALSQEVVITHITAASTPAGAAASVLAHI